MPDKKDSHQTLEILKIMRIGSPKTCQTKRIHIRLLRFSWDNENWCTKNLFSKKKTWEFWIVMGLLFLHCCLLLYSLLHNIHSRVVGLALQPVLDRIWQPEDQSWSWRDQIPAGANLPMISHVKEPHIPCHNQMPWKDQSPHSRESCPGTCER